MNYTKRFYDNCEIYSPDNVLLGHCNFDKFNWYLKKDLAIKLSDKSLKLKFVSDNWNTFIPNLTKKENHCVNCGVKKDLTRHHVIPKCYLRFFPLELKCNNSHDVVLLCGDCHSNYEQHATIVKHKLGEKYDSPLDVKKEHIKLFKAYSCLVHLMNYQTNSEWNKSKMILNMMYTVEEHIPNISYTDEELKRIRLEVSNLKKSSHGKVIMDNITDYQEFAEMWRLHFIETMEPAFMNESWDYKTNIEKCTE